MFTNLWILFICFLGGITGSKCIQNDETPNYARPAQPGQLFGIMPPGSMPPAATPNPILTDADLADPPIPPAVTKPPPPSSNGSTAPSPGQTSSQPPKIVVEILLCSLAIVVGLLFM